MIRHTINLSQYPLLACWYELLSEQARGQLVQLVRDQQAEALEEAAQWAEDKTRGRVSGSSWLRERAAAIRRGGKDA